MRGVEIAELVLLAVALLLAAALLHQFCRRRLLLLSGIGTATNKQPELPLSHPSTASPPTKHKQTCLTLLLTLCSGRRRRRARVEPASANPAEASPAAAVEVDDVARWFGPASRALYTIDEEDEDEERPPSELETPFYTPPVSPPRLGAQSPPAASSVEAFSRP